MFPRDIQGSDPANKKVRAITTQHAVIGVTQRSPFCDLSIMITTNLVVIFITGVGYDWPLVQRHLIGLLRQTAERTNKGKSKGKGKAIPLQAWTGPEGSRKFRLPDFKTVGT